MKLLLDTQALLLAGSGDLPKMAAGAYKSGANEVFFSLVSLWEIGIKASLGKLRFKRTVSAYYALLTEEAGLTPLWIDVGHIERAVKLPFHHRDPFDRLLAGQALLERLTVLSGDVVFERYGCKRIWD